MKFSLFAQTCALVALLQPATCWPALKNTAKDLENRLAARQANNFDGDPNPDLIGDLNTTGPVTSVGKSVFNILNGSESGEAAFTGWYIPPGLPGTAKCKADTCCVWGYVSLELSILFKGLLTGRCNGNARAAIRLGFHDAAGWRKGATFGGADGSIALNTVEIARAENNGLQAIIGKLQAIQQRYGVGMADLIQFAAVHAVVTCPLGPRIRFFAGRRDNATPNPTGLLPGVNDSADTLIQLFADKTITPHELAALVGAHTASQQFFVNTTQAGAPQDSTPGVWDVRFYNQTVAPVKGVFRFASDMALANDSRIASEWQAFASPVDGQSHWNEDYATAYTRLSLLGVNNINNLTECTKVLPPKTTSFPDAWNILTSLGQFKDQ